jgi:TetR/AcrR family transcriptional regulator, transcriptional repressor for nem operon
MCLSLLQVFTSRREYSKGVAEPGAGGPKWRIPVTGRISNASWDRSVSSKACILQPATVLSPTWYYSEEDVRKGEQTRQEIIRKAAPIFNQKGYEGAALSDLMRATGLEKGGIYRHFESKEELAGDAFDHAWEVAMDARFEGTEKIPNTVDRLKQIVRNFRDRRTGLVPGGCPLLNTAIDSDDGNPQLRAKARQALSSLLDRMQSIAEEGQRRGEVRADVDSAKLATLIASTLEGSIMVSRLQKKEEPRDLAVRHLEEYLDTKVRARKSKAGVRKS